MRISCVIALGITAGCEKVSGMIGGEAETEAAPAGGDAEAPAEEAPESDAPPPGPTGGAGPAPAVGGGSGPKLAWQIELAGVPRQVLLDPNGTMVVVFDDKITGLHDGLEMWTKEGSFGEVLRLKDGSMVATRGPEVLAFEPGDGAERFVVAPPSKAGAKDGAPAEVVAAARFGLQVLVATASAEFFVVDPPTCQGKEPGCVRPAGNLEGEYLEPTATLAVGDDGTRFLVEEGTVRAFDIALETLFRVDLHSPVVGLLPVSDRLALVFGGEAAMLDVAPCRARDEFSLGRRGSSAPPKCVKWRYPDDVDDVPPAVLDPNTLAVNGGGTLQAVADGDDRWKIPIDSIGPVLTDGLGLLFTICTGQGGGPMSVKAVSADRATVEWVVPLPISVPADEAIAPSTLLFDRAGAWLAAGLEQRLAMLALPGDIPGSER